MTLRELMGKNGGCRLEVINAQAGLDRPVSTVESSETPDIVAYVPKNTLLITTAMAYKDDQESLCGLIRALDALPCAGIAIKLGRFITRLDQAVVETADSLGFPLLLIPMEFTLGEVYHHLLACLWDNENEELQFTINSQKMFHNLILHGAPLKKLLASLGQIVKCPVLIVDIFGDIHACSQTNRQQNELAVKTILELNLNDKELWQYRRFTDKQITQHYYIYPIRAESGNTHFLVIFENVGSALNFSPFVMDQILMIFGIHFYKNLYQTFNEILLRENFLRILVDRNNNECLTAQQILTTGQQFGLRSCALYKVIAGRFTNMKGKRFHTTQFMRKEENYILIYSWLKSQIELAHDGDFIVLPDTSQWSYVILMQQTELNIDKKLKKIHGRIQKALGEELIFSTGNNVFKVKSIENSYWQAVDGLDEIGPNDWANHYKPKSVMELIKSISSSQIDEVCVNLLKDLAQPQNEMMADLKKTLRAYLDCHCSIMETAGRLYMHRNTVRYRIKKCEEILGNDLTDPEYCFQLQFALMLSEM